METLDPNGGRGRPKPQKRANWASVLMNSRTVKALMALMPLLIRLVSAFVELVKAFRN